MKIEKGRNVKLSYLLKSSNGDVIESSKDKGPLTFIVGSGQLPVPDLEKQILGLSKGDKKEGKLPIPVENPPKREQPRSAFPADADLEVGSFFEANLEETPVVLKVAETTPEKVVVEVLHYLEYAVEVLDVGEGS